MYTGKLVFAQVMEFLPLRRFRTCHQNELFNSLLEVVPRFRTVCYGGSGHKYEGLEQ